MWRLWRICLYHVLRSTQKELGFELNIHSIRLVEIGRGRCNELFQCTSQVYQHITFCLPNKLPSNTDDENLHPSVYNDKNLRRVKARVFSVILCPLSQPGIA